jgi:hypothetical protein
MPDGTIVLLAQEPVGLISMNGTYAFRHHDAGTDLGESWREAAFNDAGWGNGMAPFDVFRSSVTAPPPFCRLTLPVINVPVQTCLNLSNATASALVQTYYFRGQFVLPGNPTNAALRFRALLDDGAVFYVNGAEVARVGMGPDPVSYSTFASRTVPQAGFEEFIAGAPALVAGTNLLAVEVHQAAANGLDATFGLELTALLTTPPSSGPRLSLSILSGRATLTWQPPFGTLEAADDLDGPWGAVSPSNPPNQHTTDALGLRKFYRVTSP